MSKSICFIAFLLGIVTNVSGQSHTVVDSIFSSTSNLYSLIVQKNGMMGVVNDTGKVILPTIYDKIEALKGKNEECSRWEGILKVRKGGSCGLLLADGKPICPFSFDDIVFFPETCLGTTPESMVIKYIQMGKVGLGDARGNMLIRTSYEDVYLLKDSAQQLIQPAVAVVRKEGKFGMMELQHKIVMKADYDSIGFVGFIKESAKAKAKTDLVVKVKQKGLWGLVNLTTQEVFERAYTYIGRCADGLIVVKNTKKYGYIDLNNKEKIDMEYDMALPFVNKVALVNKNGKWGLINQDGKANLPLQYEELQTLFPKETEDKFLATLYLVKKDKKYGILSATGQVIVPLEYEKLVFKQGDYTGKGWKDGKAEEVEMQIPQKTTK
ncbi:MAG: WG repeat-containing protein [Thermoflexibacteraceae bacterium]